MTRMQKTIMVLLGAALAIPSIGLAAEKYPNKPITLIYPWPVGGLSDVLTRTMQPFLEELLGVPVLPVAKPGGAMEVGTVILARAEPDGYTIGQVSDPPFVPLGIKTNAKFSLDDFAYIATTSWDEVSLSVQPNGPYTKWEAFIEGLKSGKMKFSISGVGNTDEYWGFKKFIDAVGAKPIVVPFDGFAPAETALAGGHVDATTGNVGSMALRPDIHHVVVTMGNKRSQYFPNVPTAKERGYDAVMAAARVFVVPAATPPDRIKVLRDAFAALAKNPKAQKALADKNLPIEYLDATETRAYIEEQKKSFKAMGGF